MSKKYELVKVEGSNLYRIRALKDFSDVKKGDIGGYVESEENLSHEGDCWIYDEAKAYGNARVTDNAQIRDNAKLFENAKVYGDALVCGDACVTDYASVWGSAKIRDNATLYHTVKVYDYAKIVDSARLYNYVEVFGHATTGGVVDVCGNAKIHGHTKIWGNVTISDKVEIYGNTILSNNLKISGDTIICDNMVIWGKIAAKEATTANKKHNNENAYFDSHYQGDIQPIEYMQSNLSEEKFIGFLLGNIIKYAGRFGKKDDIKKEAVKIHRYAEWLEQAVCDKRIVLRKEEK